MNQRTSQRFAKGHQWCSHARRGFFEAFYSLLCMSRQTIFLRRQRALTSSPVIPKERPSQKGTAFARRSSES